MSDDDAKKPSRRLPWILASAALLVLLLAAAAAPAVRTLTGFLADCAAERARSKMEERDREALDYARDHIAVDDVKIEWFEDVIHAHTVAFRGTLVNNGVKPVESLWIKVGFLGEAGETVGEDDVVVFASGGYLDREPPLMPGARRAFAMSLNHAPDDWKEEFGAFWEFSAARFFEPPH